MENTKTTVKKITITRVTSSFEILPFPERAAAERGTTANDGKAQISACNLFQLFTADIIKADKIFIR